MNRALHPFRPVRGIIEFLGGLAILLTDTCVTIPAALLSERVRVKSIPIVGLVLFCIGSILALQMAPILREYGKLDSVADVISVAIFRELGPLVSAIVLSGFAGASIAAEMG